MSQPGEDRGESPKAPEATEPVAEDPRDVLRLSAADGARLIAENGQLRDALKEMAIERAELYNKAEGAGEALQEAKALRDAARIDPAIAIFARIMDGVAGDDPILKSPTAMARAIHDAVDALERLYAGSSLDPVEFYRRAAILAVRGMRLADLEADRAKKLRAARRETLLRDR